MPKYGTKTYGRNRARETKISKEFDEIQKSENSKANVTSENTFTRRLSRRSPWSRTSRIVESNLSDIKEAAVDSSKTSKRRKLGVIEERDPFAFDEDDVTVSSSSKESTLRGNATGQSIQAPSTDLTDKSTDDEAYSSSQELSESSSQGGERRISWKKLTASPFKSFLKNNDKSLSPKKEILSRRLSALPTSADFSEDSQDEVSPDVPNLGRSASWPRRKVEDSSSIVRVKRTEKPLFTVVQNVKQVHECLESGEDQQFFDDVEYLLDGLKQSRSIATRCLSALDFASHCSQPSFRVSLRAHGIAPKIFSALQDAPSDKCLALCTSAITLMLSQDRQNADLDRSVLELMMKLLAVDSNNQQSKSLKDYNKYVTKVRTLLEKQDGSDDVLLAAGDEDINPASLVCESMLSLTSQRTGEWFKEEIRVLRGLDHIMDIAIQTIDNLLTRYAEGRLHKGVSIAKVKKMTRCMRLLENVTVQHSANQEYMIHYEKGSFVTSLVRLLQLCLNTLNHGVSPKQPKKKPDKAFEHCFFSILKVFLNLTHNFEAGSSCIGQQEDFLSSLLLTVLQLPQFVTENKRFDLLVLSLELLINLVEESKPNVASLVQLRTSPCHESEDSSQEQEDQGGQLSSIEALVQLFLIREQAARNTDEMTSGLSTEEESSQESFKPTKDGMGWICGEDIDVSVDEGNKKAADVQEEDDVVPLEVQLGKALQKAGKHMEDSVVAAYVALLLGCILQENEANQCFVRGLLPEGDFSLLVNVLRKFLRFMKLTSGTSGHAIEKIVKVLEGCQTK